MSLAHRGVEAGISRAKFEHWVPFNFVAAPEDQPVLATRGSAEFSQQEALRRHTLAVVCSGIGMQTTSKSEDSSGCVFLLSKNAFGSFVDRLVSFFQSESLIHPTFHLVWKDEKTTTVAEIGVYIG